MKKKKNGECLRSFMGYEACRKTILTVSRVIALEYYRIAMHFKVNDNLDSHLGS